MRRSHNRVTTNECPESQKVGATLLSKKRSLLKIPQVELYSNSHFWVARFTFSFISKFFLLVPVMKCCHPLAKTLLA